MKVVLLCGGKGTRLREETEYRPKPMVPIGGKPILWHIMKTYAEQGHKEFILCLGYKGDMIKNWFKNYHWMNSDVTLSLGEESKVTFHNGHDEEDWTVTLAETGENSMTAYRVREIEKYLGEDKEFLLTYGDGVGNIAINAAILQHQSSSAVCTLTGVHPPGRFGELGISKNDVVTHFNEKPQAEGGYINGGYMVCNRKIFDYLPDDPGMMLENSPMDEMVRDSVLGVYRHDGFWQPMDTYAEFIMLNKMWEEDRAPWVTWK